MLYRSTLHLAFHSLEALEPVFHALYRRLVRIG